MSDLGSLDEALDSVTKRVITGLSRMKSAVVYLQAAGTLLPEYQDGLLVAIEAIENVAKQIEEAVNKTFGKGQ